MADEVKNEVKPVVIEGAFVVSLKRNNSKIKQDRAQAIGETAQLVYRREVEDLEMLIKNMKRDQENMLDLSPENAMTLIVASDFDAKAFTHKDIELGVNIRNAEIQLDIAKRRYAYLFGGV